MISSSDEAIRERNLINIFLKFSIVRNDELDVVSALQRARQQDVVTRVKKPELVDLSP
jgi:hypothetical protein